MRNVNTKRLKNNSGVRKWSVMAIIKIKVRMSQGTRVKTKAKTKTKAQTKAETTREKRVTAEERMKVKIVILRFISSTTPDYKHKMAGLSKHMVPSMQRGLSRTTNPTSPPKV